MIDIIEQLNLENGSNYKLAVLQEHKDNELLKRVLKMTYDKVAYTYGITMKNIPEVLNDGTENLDWALDLLEAKFVTREYTGNKAIEELTFILETLSKEDALIIEMILNRDLRINVGKTNINKVFKNLITKPPYMRCSLMDKLDRVTYPALIQTKADGTYRSLIVENGKVTSMSRSGEQDDFPIFFNRVNVLPDGVYIGELLVRSETDRFKANGLINSLTEPEDMYIQVWDYLTLEEWTNKKSDTHYAARFCKLKENINNDFIELIETVTVKNYEEAQAFYKDQVAKGLEGAVLKDMCTPFKDHTSPTQIKLKEEAVAEFVVTGFEEGKGRLAGTLGAMDYCSGDGLVKGKMGGFSDGMRKEIWENQDKYLNSVVSVKYNGVSKAKGSDIYNLMYANFEEFRTDKDEADDLDYIKKALK